MAGYRERRRQIAKEFYAEQAARRKAEGLPDPAWYEHPLPLVFLLAAAVTLFVSATSWIFTTVGAITVGIALVVLLGASGLVLRGLGEQASDAVRGKRLKAVGYYLGASAYVATASVALFNGLPHILAASVSP